MSSERKPTTGNRFVKIYRKLRYLSYRGTLLSSGRKKVGKRINHPDALFRIITLNSLVFFLLGYLVVYLIYLFTTGISANAFNITVNISHFGVEYFMRGNEWSSDAVKGVFSAGPIILLILTITLLILYSKVMMENGILRLLLIWMILHGLTRFFGEIMMGSIMTKGFGYVILYLFIMDTGKLIITVLAFVAMFTLGILLAKMLYYSANTYFTELKSNTRFRFFWHQFMLPFLLGNLVIFLIKLPDASPFDIAVNLSMVLILLPVGIHGRSLNDLYFDDEPRTVKFMTRYAAVTLLLLIMFRVILGFGIQLG